MQHHQQQSLPPEQQQQQQINNYTTGYPEAQTYEGWPGMALKQIMGQIDLFNFQNPNYGVNPKWQLNKDFVTNNSNGGYMTQCEGRMPMNTSQPQQQQQQQQQQFKTNNFESVQQDNDNAMAWLGPQLWNRRIGVEVSISPTFYKKAFTCADPKSTKIQSSHQYFLRFRDLLVKICA